MKTDTLHTMKSPDPFADAPQPEYVQLGRIRVNPGNPRTITKEKFAKLVNSILIAPWMLPIRALVVDETLTILGGNMRHNAIASIAEMDHAAVRARLESLDEFRSIPEGDRPALLRFWERWLESPTEPILRAEQLTEAQKRRFIITDNASFGDWDIDALANEWDPDLLSDWGLDLDWDSLRMNNVNPDDLDDQFTLPDGEKSPFQQMTIIFSNEQAELVRSCIDEMLESGTDIETFGNEHAKGNALYEICRQWAGQRR